MLGHLLVAVMAIAATDQTVQVTKGTKLDVNNFAGDVSIKVWDRDAVRVEVTHSDRETVDIKPGEQTLLVRSRSVRGGPPRSLDYTITVPKWMAIAVNGTYADVTMDGVGGDVTVETTRGDINITGGSGVVLLKSIQGLVNLQKAKGRIEVRAVNEGMHLSDISGDLSAETTNGSIILDRVDSGNVDLYTVNGNISYDGPIKDKGVYRLTTHNGMIAVAIPERVNATLMVRTYNGSFRSTFPVKQDDQNPRKRLTLTLGNGSAHLELESFGGTIALRRPGEPRPEVEREKRKRERDSDKEKEKAKDQAGLFRIPDGVQMEINRAATEAMRAAQPEIDQAIRDIQPEIDRAVTEAMRDVQPEIDRAMRDIQPEINAAMSEAMRHVPFVVPMPNPMPMPLPMPMPKPRW
jgi:putative adhesin